MWFYLKISPRTVWFTRSKENYMKKLGIIGAMSIEVENLKKAMTDMKITEKAGMAFY